MFPALLIKGVQTLNSLKVVILYDADINHEILLVARTVIQEVFNAEVIEIRRVEIPDTFYDPYRDQYLADLVVEHISYFKPEESYAILLSSRDAYVPGLNFVFGLAMPLLRSAAVFLPRLMLGNSTTTIFSRVEKEVLHEFGHLLGLEHCKTPGCVMNFSNSVRDVDRKTNKFCKNCASKLRERGIIISEKYILE